MLRRLMLLPALALLSTSCGGGDAACNELREPQDPASGIHLIDPDGGEWQTHPPTSGPHLSAPMPRGVMVTPIATAMQVSILESGQALVQYADSVDASDVAVLESLADDNAVVAPGEDLPARIVATAWTWKLTCKSLDFAALQTFVTTRPAEAPGAD